MLDESVEEGDFQLIEGKRTAKSDTWESCSAGLLKLDEQAWRAGKGTHCGQNGP